MIQIRRAAESDEADLYPLVSAFPTPTLVTMPEFRVAYRTKMTDSSSCVAVAERDGELVGYVSGYSHATFYAAGPVAWVDEIFVGEQDRRKGVGRQLMSHFEQWAESEGCVLVGLATAGASEFYKRLGFESTAGYYKKYFGSQI